MPEKKTMERARQTKGEGKEATTLLLQTIQC